jgi:hypothetical protein
VGVKRSFLALTLGRVGLFLLCALLVRLVSVALDHPINGLTLLLVALLISSPIGVLVFSSQRQAVAEALVARKDVRARQAAERRARIENDS